MSRIQKETKEQQRDNRYISALAAAIKAIDLHNHVPETFNAVNPEYRETYTIDNQDYWEDHTTGELIPIDAYLEALLDG